MNKKEMVSLASGAFMTLSGCIAGNTDATPQSLESTEIPNSATPTAQIIQENTGIPATNIFFDPYTLIDQTRQIYIYRQISTTEITHEQFLQMLTQAINVLESNQIIIPDETINWAIAISGSGDRDNGVILLNDEQIQVLRIDYQTVLDLYSEDDSLRISAWHSLIEELYHIQMNSQYAPIWASLDNRRANLSAHFEEYFAQLYVYESLLRLNDNVEALQFSRQTIYTPVNNHREQLSLGRRTTIVKDESIIYSRVFGFSSYLTGHLSALSLINPVNASEGNVLQLHEEFAEYIINLPTDADPSINDFYRSIGINYQGTILRGAESLRQFGQRFNGFISPTLILNQDLIFFSEMELNEYDELSNIGSLPIVGADSFIRPIRIEMDGIVNGSDTPVEIQYFAEDGFWNMTVEPGEEFPRDLTFMTNEPRLILINSQINLDNYQFISYDDASEIVANEVIQEIIRSGSEPRATGFALLPLDQVSLPEENPIRAHTLNYQGRNYFYISPSRINSYAPYLVELDSVTEIDVIIVESDPENISQVTLNNREYMIQSLETLGSRLTSFSVHDETNSVIFSGNSTDELANYIEYELEVSHTIRISVSPTEAETTNLLADFTVIPNLSDFTVEVAHTNYARDSFLITFFDDQAIRRGSLHFNSSLQTFNLSGNNNFTRYDSFEELPAELQNLVLFVANNYNPFN